MATTVIQVSDLTPELLAQLRAAQPEQVGDDLVLRLPDGRVFFVDGFFALNETGDGLPPLEGAIELAADIGALLLGSTDLATAAGGEDQSDGMVPPNSGTGFQTFSPETAKSPAPGQELIGGNGQGGLDPFSADGGLLAPSGYGSFQPQQNDGGSQSGSAGSLGLPPVGAISLAAGSVNGPPWAGYFDIRMLYDVEKLADPQFANWFYGFSKAKALQAPVGLADFTAWFQPANFAADVTQVYALYQRTHFDLADYADGRAIWANVLPFLDTFSTFDNSDSNTLPAGNTPAAVFGQNDMIIGGDNGVDRLYGFDGNDILIGFGGENHLFGGNGNDVLSFVQDSSPLEADGGDGDDTLLMSVTRSTVPIIARNLGTFTSIEHLILLPESPDNPVFLNDDFGAGKFVPGNLVLVLDAQTVLDWGGKLFIDSAAADIRLSDIDDWTRLPADPAHPGYGHYQASVGAKVVDLWIIDGADQPIAGLVTGTTGDDRFFLGDRKFAEFDGGPGNDQILGGIFGEETGKLKLDDPATVPFHNIESITLALPTDQITLSAAGIAAMTDSRKTLWITGAEFNSAPATGEVDLVDPTQWTALGYLSVKTFDDPIDDAGDETRIGAYYGATYGGSNVYLFVQLGMQQPIVGNTAALDHWFVQHSGQVYLPPTATIADLSVIDLANTGANLLLLDAATVADFAGPDKTVSIIGDDTIDMVDFSDYANWKFSHIDGGFTVYESNDGLGHVSELRIASTLGQPFLLPDPGVGDIDMTNGHSNRLTLNATIADDQAGADNQLTVLGDAVDFLVFSDPANWRLAGKDAGFYVYDVDDGAGHSMQLRVDPDIAHPGLLPVGTAADDVLYVTSESFVYGTVDGKGGFDVVKFLDGGYIFNVSHDMKSIEGIDLTNGSANTLDVGAIDFVKNGVSGTVFVTGDAGDTVLIGDPSRWTHTAPDVQGPGTGGIPAHTFIVYDGIYHTAGGTDVTVQLAIDQALTQPVI